MHAPLTSVVVQTSYVVDAVQAAGAVQLVEVHWAVSSASAAEQSAQLAHVYVAPPVVL